MTPADEYSEDINNLPDELIISIFKLLPLDSLLTCEDVCVRWRKLATDGALWRRLLIVYSGKPGETEVSSRNLQVILTHGDLINNLKLQYVYDYTTIKSILDNCSNLINLELVMCRIGQDFEEDVIRWPHLKKINLKNSLLQNRNDVQVQYDQFKNLNYLALSDFGLNSVNCNSLLACKHLTHIFIEKIRDLTLEFITELIQTKQHIVEAFHIYGGNAVNDKCLKLLSQCPQLKDLAIIRCEDLTDAGLIHLTNLKKIEHLQIWNNTNFTEMNLLRILGSPNLIKLSSLSLSRIGSVSPVIVDVISEYYKQLKFLALYQCPRIINTDYEKQLKSKFRKIDVVLY